MQTEAGVLSIVACPPHSERVWAAHCWAPGVPEDAERQLGLRPPLSLLMGPPSPHPVYLGCSFPVPPSPFKTPRAPVEGSGSSAPGVGRLRQHCWPVGTGLPSSEQGSTWALLLCTEP